MEDAERKKQRVIYVIVVDILTIVLTYAITCSLLERQLAYDNIIEYGGKGIRTPDFQLAKLALYQLSYAPL